MSTVFDTLDELRRQAEECRECPLSTTRNRVVFGFGDPCANLMFVGEAPGRNEDLRGEPFVGAAGKFFDELLRSIHLDRSDVYITNLLKCRPPGNRNPTPAEIAACANLLRRQVALVHPKILVTLGNFSTRFVLKTTETITKQRGIPQHKGFLTVIPVYHPAAAIYDVTKRETLLADFSVIGELLNAERPSSDKEDGCGDLRK
ncbi:MAG: uracil-DNA glycosylase [Actinobacteria bacterium]|nr:uracil-DNA glycosylase [Actinomycetota bacterium]